jgi:hypothetical protein
VIYVVGSQQYVGYVKVPSVIDFFDEAAHQCLVVLFGVRHRSFSLLPTRVFLAGRHHLNDATWRGQAHRLGAYSPNGV